MATKKTSAKKTTTKKTTTKKPAARKAAAGRTARSRGRGVASSRSRADAASVAGPHVELTVQDKREAAAHEERTHSGRYFSAVSDIFETDESLVVVMDVPGVTREQVEIRLDNDVLSVEGRVDFEKYRDMVPVYTEYDVGHFARQFTLSDTIDRDGITATVRDGVLTIDLPKAGHVRPRRIPVG